MEDSGIKTDVVVDAAAHHYLSKRGTRGLLYQDVWGPREKSMSNPWSPANPGGTYVKLFSFLVSSVGLIPGLSVILRLAENSLMHGEVAAFIKEKVVPLETCLGVITDVHRSTFCPSII